VRSNLTSRLRHSIGRDLIVRSVSAGAADVPIVDVGNIRACLPNYPIAPTRAPRIFVMQATRQRSGAHPEAAADPMAESPRSERKHHEAGQVGE